MQLSEPVVTAEFVIKVAGKERRSVPVEKAVAFLLDALRQHNGDEAAAVRSLLAELERLKRLV